MNTIKKVLGFTLIELMVTLTIIVLITMFGIPAIMDQIRREQMVAQTQSMYNYILNAQELAASTGRPIVIIPETEGDADTYWNQPLVMAYVPVDLLTKSDNPDDPGGLVTVAQLRVGITPGNTIARETIFPVTPDATLAVAFNNQAQFGVGTPGSRPPGEKIFDTTNAGTGFMLFTPDGTFNPPLFTYVDNTTNNVVTQIARCRPRSVVTANPNPNYLHGGVYSLSLRIFSGANTTTTAASNCTY